MAVQGKIITELPYRGKMVDWKSIVGMDIKFEYENKHYTVHINDYNKGRLFFTYENKLFDMLTGNFKKCKFGSVIGKRVYDFKWNIGDTVKDSKRNLTIVDRFYQPLNDGKRRKAYKVQCNKCRKEYEIVEDGLISGHKCLYCSNIVKKVDKNINSVWKTHPYLVKYFVNVEDSYKYSHGSNEKVMLKCPECKTIKEMVINSFTNRGFICDVCSDGVSFPNKMIRSLILQLDNLYKLQYYEFEYSPIWANNRSYDVYFEYNNKKYIVEMDGGFHFIDNEMNGQTMEKSQKIDEFKDKIAKKHDIEVIRVNCDYDSMPIRFQYIKQNIYDSELSTIFMLKNVNWEEVKECAFKSLLLETWKLWDKGYSNNEISTKLNLEISTINKYLVEGSRLGTLKRKRQITKRKSYNRKKVKCVETGIVYNSATEASRKLNIANSSHIGSCCKNLKGFNTCGGYHWEYEEVM